MNLLTTTGRTLALALCLLSASACGKPPSTDTALPGRAPPTIAGSNESLPEGDYFILSRNSYKPVTAYRTADGAIAAAQLSWAPDRRDGEIWTVRKKDDGLLLYSRHFDRYLAMPKGSEELGDVAQMQTSAELASRWKLAYPVMGSWGLVDAVSGQALCINNNFANDGMSLVQYDQPNGAENAQFFFVPVSAAGTLRHALAGDPLAQSRYDNQQGRYHLAALLPATIEAQRGRRTRLMDIHPSGLFVRRGETIQLQVQGGQPIVGDGLVVMVGQPNAFWDDPPAQNPQRVRAHPGDNAFTAARDGLLYFEYLDPGVAAQPTPPVDVVVRGGTAIPFYVQGQTTPEQWRSALRQSDAPWVEMVGSRSMATITRALYDNSNREEPRRLIDYMESIVRNHDQISGFDGSSWLHTPPAQRLHFMQDTVTPPKAVENVFMYAGDYFIGMPEDSANLLLNAPWDADAWGLWHEAGHTYQQSDWTWGAVGETTVNLYSITMQERVGQEWVIRKSDPDSGRTLEQWSQAYLGQSLRRFNDDAGFPEGASSIWVRLALFEQLRQHLGDAFYQKLHRYYREHPLSGEDLDDDQRVQAFIYRSSLIAGQDLSGFFETWGLPADEETLILLRQKGLPKAQNMARFD